MRKQISGKKGNLQATTAGLFVLASAVIALVVFGLISAFGSDILQDQQSSFEEDNLGPSCGQNSTGGSSGTILYTECGQAYNSTADANLGIGELTERTDTIALVTVAVFIIGILITGFGAYMMVK